MLLIDAGNAFLKWCWLARGELGPARATVHHGVEAAEWQAKLRNGGARPARVLVANVAGAAFAQRLAEFTRAAWGVEPEFPVAERAALGLTNACVEPAALGIDRWLALVAAWRRVRAPLVCASAGTAFALDVVDGEGRHRGGCRVPGARLMRESLYAQTSGVASAALLDAPATDGAFGVNTAGGVRQGARLALAALADRRAHELERALGAPARIVLTGGAAPQVAVLMRHPVEQVPDLVLRGLALLVDPTVSA